MKHVLLTIAIALAGGCTHRATMSAPSGFGRLDGPYDYRAVNPVGVVVAARREPNHPRSDLGFWTAAVDLSLERKGYTRTGAADVKSASGVPGRLLKYDTGNGAAYWIAVYEVGDELVIAEATGFKDDLEASADQIEASLRSAALD